jgi:putative transposase
VQGLEGLSSRMLLEKIPYLRKQFWGRHLWARGYVAVTTGAITDKMIKEYIGEQEGEPVNNASRFRIDDHSNLPPS